MPDSSELGERSPKKVAVIPFEKIKKHADIRIRSIAGNAVNVESVVETPRGQAFQVQTPHGETQILASLCIPA